MFDLPIEPPDADGSILGRRSGVRNSQTKWRTTHLIPKVRRLCHLAEKTNFDNPSQHLDLGHNLTTQMYQRPSARCPSNKTYDVRVNHVLAVERRVDDEVSVIRNNRTSLLDSHPERSFRRTQNVVQILQHFGVCEWHDFNWYTLSELLDDLGLK